MSDITERLRAYCGGLKVWPNQPLSRSKDPVTVLVPELEIAADEIASLRESCEEELTYRREAERERDAAQAQVAVLTGRLNALLQCPAIADGDLGSDVWGCAESAAAAHEAEVALRDTAPTADAHDKRVRAEALVTLKGIVDDCCLTDATGKIVNFDHADFDRRFHALSQKADGS